VSSKDSSRVSLVALAVAVVTVGVGTAAGLAFVPTVGTYVGMLAGGFVAGLVLEARPTVESGVAAALASVGVLVAGALPGTGVVDAVLSLAAVDPVTLSISLVLAFAVGAFGGHFGDDLRDGLTEPLPDPSPTASSQRADGRSTTADADALASRDDERTTTAAGDPASDVAEAERRDAADGQDSGADETVVDRERSSVDREQSSTDGAEPDFELEEN
jgi:hypothetical protein